MLCLFYFKWMSRICMRSILSSRHWRCRRM